jgi:hypothetical protein
MLRAADRDLTQALRVVEQAVGKILEKNEGDGIGHIHGPMCAITVVAGGAEGAGS